MMQGKAFDEVWGDGGGDTPREGFEALARWISETPPQELDRRQQAAEAAFRQLGITFAVYGEDEAAERIIPFDIVPRIFSQPEWKGLKAGLEQRCEAINAFLADVYGPRKILADGVIPAELVLTNSQFRPQVAGIRPPHDVYAHICGIDMVRTGPTDFFVLEDNARTPSGVSYMLENREAMIRLCPEIFEMFPVEPVDDYTDLLLQTLRSVAPHGRGQEPVCVLLTPGHFNSAFYEHSFLADAMGIELVEAADLEVDDDIVWMRTIDGRVRVDVIYRRLDDDYLDPLVFKRDSMLGVPGIMAAYLAGNVTLTNAPGTGIADDKAIYSYMPEIVRYYTGSDAKLPNVETFRCREAAGAAIYARQSRATGRQAGRRIGRLRHARRADRVQGRGRALPRRADRRAASLHRPADAGALHRADAGRGGRGTAPRRFPALLPVGRQWREDRAGRADPRGASRRLAGGQFEPGWRHQGQPDPGGSPAPPRQHHPLDAQRSRLMLSRTAASLYWLGRYIERAEFTARLIEATMRLDLLSARPAGEGAWESALAVSTAEEGFWFTGEPVTPEAVTRYLALVAREWQFDPLLPRCRAFSNAKSVRTAL